MSDIQRWSIEGRDWALLPSERDGNLVFHDDHAAELARLREELDHEKKQRAFNDRHLERMDCGAFRIGIPYEESTCDPAKPCIRCARAKELARLRAVVAEAHEQWGRERESRVRPYRPCACIDCTAHRASAQEKPK